MRDSTVQVVYRDPISGTWRDARDREVGWPLDPGPDRAVTTVWLNGDQPDVALVHDVSLLDDSELLEGVGGLVLADWRHAQLTADLGRALTDLEESRRRIAEAADVERARIERDLHDGAQQRLIGLRIRLGLAEERIETDPAAGIEMVRELGFEAEAALDELRALASGVYPAVLIDRGVADALRSLAALAPEPVHVAAAGVTRHAVEIESAIYFVCVEAVQNALKHGHGATGVWVTLRQTPDRFGFEVRDDGRGFDVDAADGRGLRNMRDRIEAIGGWVRIDSKPLRETRVTGAVPLR
jgi:signal transduction histidine kinase